MIAPGKSGLPEIPYMSHPMLKVTGIFSSKSAQARPEELLVVEGSMASDRIRHVQYTDIARISLGRTFALRWAICLGTAGVIVLGATVRGYAMASALFFMLAIVFGIGIIRGLTVLVIEHGGGKLVFSSSLVSRKRMEDFFAALRTNLRRAQGEHWIRVTPKWLREEEPAQENAGEMT